MLKIKGKEVYVYIEIFVVLVMVVLASIIGYLSFSSGSKESRDTKRLSDILSISDHLKIYYSKNSFYPLPDESVKMTASGEVLTYQGYVSSQLSQTIGLNDVKDPLGDDNFRYLNEYTYATDSKRKKIQLMAFLEGNKNFGLDLLLERSPMNYADKVGIALETSTKRPIQETKRGVDILKTNESYELYFDDKKMIVGDGSILKVLMSQTLSSKSISCKEIKNSGVDESGYYYLNPLSNTAYEKFSKPFLAYCDMQSDGGGWTRLNYKTTKESCFNDGGAYNKFIIEKLFTTDFGVSDNTGTLLSTGSWILHDIKTNEKGFDISKLMNVANCKTPLGTDWNMNYGENDETGDTSFLTFIGKLSTLGNWTSMFYGCGKYADVGSEVSFRIGGRIGHTGEFISASCNDYSDVDHSITSRWDWDNTRVLWVR